MRLASWLLISVAVHTVILSLPVSFLERRGEQIVVPVILVSGGGEGRVGTGGEGGMDGGKREATPPARQHRAGVQRTEEQNPSDGSDREETTDPTNRLIVINGEFSGQGLMVADFKGEEGGQSVSFGATGEGGNGAGFVGNGNAQGGTGFGGSRGEGGLPGSGFARVTYAYNPRPSYPETARRKGWEGTVILRVLVDREGSSRLIEISRSSGFDTLDRAAVETVKSWRFHPAHYGQGRVESWVKIPIVFSLSDSDRGS